MKSRVPLFLIQHLLGAAQFRRKSSWARPAALSGAVAFLAVLLVSAPQPAHSQTESVLHSFSTSPDGSAAYAKLTLGAHGNFYSTTANGGANGHGTVFEITPSGTETVLYSFAGSPDGANPTFSSVAFDKAGNLYGTTSGGGANGGLDGYGTVFKLTPVGTETVLYSFAGPPTDGYQPNSGVILDTLGNLYGTTVSGGANGYGTVFKVTSSGTESVLYSFAGGTDGCFPFAAGLVLRKNVLYGATQQCGANGYGTVFKLSLSGTETILHSFANDGTDGEYPDAGLVFDAAGNMYGTTDIGGTGNAGTVYKITPAGTESVLHSFSFNGTDGANPYGAGVILDKSGNIYGTTNGGGYYRYGAAFKITPSGTETILHSFNPNGVDGYNPTAGLVLKNNIFYGTTLSGGASTAGTVFKIVP